MKLRAILLLIMIGYDLSLHLVQLLGKVALHPLYPIFPLLGFISYDLFWSLYFGIGFLIMLTLLGSGTTIKNKTVVENHHHYPEKEEVKNE